MCVGSVVLPAYQPAGVHVHLKSLTLRGFKSFASATTLEFEPGITCVVGPNGSGKSNVVDAIAWVMGEQGAKSLRGGKMDDVIFAGTSGKAPLGRAEVLLTIDNSDGALPIDYTEVTISRTLFRSGGSEYAINGQPCRLLDVQELLSDSGIGREMHVIVGQGRLDSILHATPEDRRGFVEEAAGVLKHRKRKEKALRKLEAMNANLTRLQDLTHELRRQLKPLGRQAEVARRAQIIQTDVRDSRLRLLADDLVTFRNQLDQEEADEAALRKRRAELDERLEAARSAEQAAEQASAIDTEALARVNELHTRLTALRERYNGLVSLAKDRARYLDEPEAAANGADPDQLDQQAAAALAAAAELSTECEQLAAELADREAASAQAERVHADALSTEKRRQAALAKYREQAVRLQGARDAAASKIQARDAEIERLSTQLAGASQRIAECETQVNELSAQHDTAVDSKVQELAQAAAEAKEKRQEFRVLRDQARDAANTAARDLASINARIDALTLSLNQVGGLAALSGSGVSTVGVVSDYLRIEPGFETAVESALHFVADADAIAVADLAAATAALAHLRDTKAGRTNMVIADADAGEQLARVDLPAGARYAVDVVRPSDDPAASSVHGVVAGMLQSVVLVSAIADFAQVVQEHPQIILVSSDGDVLGRHAAIGGTGAAGRVHIVAAVEQAEADREAISVTANEAAQQLERAEAAFVEQSQKSTLVNDQFQAAKAAAAEHNSAVALAASRLEGARAEAARADKALDQARTARQADVTALEAAEEKLAVHAETDPHDNDDVAEAVDVEALRAAVVTARQLETQARLAVRTAEERINAHRRRAEDLTKTAAAEREARAQALAAAAERRRKAQIAVEVLEVAQGAAAQLERAVLATSRRRAKLTAISSERAKELTDLRAAIRDLTSQIEKLTTDVHKDEIARAQQRLRVEQIEQKALEEFGVGAEELVAEYGPDVPVPPSAVAAGDEVDPNAPAPEPYPFVRAEQEKRLRQAEKQMALLGRVNPLALEEFKAMEERHTFLNTQLEDLKRSRKDLLDIVADVDERVQQVFAEAFADVQREFVGVFGRLFPGGEGRLVLTNPDDLLNTGIEVEARPAGKKVKRLSLLSGGERSLTAVAFLVSLFKARPSPFYLMDEVEAALDDVNLGRLIGLMEELRGTSQLLIITHQKRTMEIADALYGVTMREGVTQVISQRMRELVTAG